MTLRTTKLHRPCDYCGRKFIPTTKSNRLCHSCWKKSNKGKGGYYPRSRIFLKGVKRI